MFKEAYEHIALQFTNQWEPLDCPRNEIKENFDACIWFTETHGPKLQVSKYRVGNHVKFKWSKGTLAGNIQGVWVSYEPRDNRKSYFGSGIYYTIYANGHRRWVDERLIIQE